MIRVAIVVDDEPVVAKNIHWGLRRCLPESWRCVHEVDPVKALSMIVLDDDIQLVVADVIMQPLSGIELVAQALESRPELRGRVVVCSAFPMDPVHEHLLFEQLGCKRLDKPFDFHELERIVWEILGRPPSAASG